MAKRTFIVDRSKWRCGGEGRHAKGIRYTTGLNNDGMMCCLGHTTHQCGVPMDKLKGLSMPCELGISYAKRAAMFFSPKRDKKGRFTKSVKDTMLSMVAANINDTEGLPLQRRERILRKWFNQNGYGLSFIGKSVPFTQAYKDSVSQIVKMTDEEIIAHYVNERTAQFKISA